MSTTTIPSATDDPVGAFGYLGTCPPEEYPECLRDAQRISDTFAVLGPWSTNAFFNKLVAPAVRRLATTGSVDGAHNLLTAVGSITQWDGAPFREVPTTRKRLSDLRRTLKSYASPART